MQRTGGGYLDIHHGCESLRSAWSTELTCGGVISHDAVGSGWKKGLPGRAFYVFEPVRQEKLHQHCYLLTPGDFVPLLSNYKTQFVALALKSVKICNSNLVIITISNHCHP